MTPMKGHPPTAPEAADEALRPCWSALRNAISLRGLEVLVPKGGEAAAKAMADRQYDPLITPMIWAVQLIINKRGPEAMVALDLPGSHGCVFCALREIYDIEEPPYSRDDLIAALADHSRAEATKRGLVQPS